MNDAPCTDPTALLTPFHKMHGAGNDFVVFDFRSVPRGANALTPPLIAALADRRTGIGCDQLIILTQGDPSAAADVTMRIYNPDGSEAGACGNATRCVASLIANSSDQPSGTRGTTLSIRTIAGILACEILPDGSIRVDMGAPRLHWTEIPLAREQDTLHLDLPGDPAAVSMGNPHATLFPHAFQNTDTETIDIAGLDIETIDVARIGAALEHDPLFPERANIGFAQVLDRNTIRLRVWERSAGLTRACGSGACATLVNAHRRGLTGREATLILDGGTLQIAWREADGHVLMTGPAATAFQGSVDLSTYPA